MPLTPEERRRFEAIRSGSTVAEADAMRPGLGGQFIRSAGRRGQELINLLPGEQFENNLINLPKPESFAERAAQFTGGLAPDLALGLATAPIAFGVKGALAARGVGKLASLAAGELAQSAALSPIEFATRPKGEALGVTLGSAALGTGLGYGLLKLAGRRAASQVGKALTRTAEASEEELMAFRRESESRILERVRTQSQAGRAPGARDIEAIRLEAGDAVADKAVEEGKQALRNSMREAVEKLGKICP